MKIPRRYNRPINSDSGLTDLIGALDLTVPSLKITSGLLVCGALIFTGCGASPQGKPNLVLKDFFVVLHLVPDDQKNCDLGKGSYSDIYEADNSDFKKGSIQDGGNGAPLILQTESGAVIHEDYVPGGINSAQSVLSKIDKDAMFPTLPKIENDVCVAVLHWNDISISPDVKELKLIINKRSPIRIKVSEFGRISDSYLENSDSLSFGLYSKNTYRIDITLTPNESANGGSAGPSHWYPEGFTQYSENIAYKFDNSIAQECYSFAPCWGVRVIAKDPCSEIAIEGNATDSSGALLQNVNDFISNITALQEVKITLRSSLRAARSWEMTSLECRA